MKMIAFQTFNIEIFSSYPQKITLAQYFEVGYPV